MFGSYYCDTGMLNNVLRSFDFSKKYIPSDYILLLPYSEFYPALHFGAVYVILVCIIQYSDSVVWTICLL